MELARPAPGSHIIREPYSFLPMILHPAAWVVLIVGAMIVVWFAMQDDDT